MEESFPMGIIQWVAEPMADALPGKKSKLNWLRETAARFTTPILPDDYLHLLNPLWSGRQLRGQVVNVLPETADSATLIIKPGWGFDVDYQPGQYIGIGVRIDGRFTWRSYSLTSPVNWVNGLISITVKAVPDGFLSSHLVSGDVPEGTVVRLQAPSGNFTLPRPAPPKILFVTAGSGVTPIISMLRTLRTREEKPDIVHVHSAPTADEVIFADELAQFAKADNYRGHIQLTRVDGRMKPADLAALVPDLAERQTWACGPAEMLTELESHWKAIDLEDLLHIERFAAARADRTGEGGVVTYAKSGKKVQIDGATTIMEAGEKAGAILPFGCRMGICEMCKVPIKAGFAVDLRTGEEHGEGDWVQTCISSAAGDCTVEA
jgi:ferredoxin-NADP reductase